MFDMCGTDSEKANVVAKLGESGILMNDLPAVETITLHSFKKVWPSFI